MDPSQEARDNSYAFAFEKIYHSVASVAARVLGPDGEVVAAVSIAVPLSRIGRKDILKLFRSWSFQPRAASRSPGLPQPAI